MKIPFLNISVKRIFQIVVVLTIVAVGYVGLVPDKQDSIVKVVNIDSLQAIAQKQELDSLLQAYVDSAYAPQKKSIQDYFENLNKWSGFNGNVLFAVQGKVVYEGAFGFRDLKKKDSLRVEDAFQLASVTKTITSTAVLQLVEVTSDGFHLFL